jgi:hypothetical protein
MLNFKTFMVEHTFINESTYLTEEIASSDAKGKLHELLVAKHLSSDNEEDKALPSHFRNEETQKTPQQTYDELKNSISAEDYNAADKRAKESAAAIKSHLMEHHGVKSHHVKNIYWTSNSSDHEKLTNQKDPNSDADIMLHTVGDKGEHNFHGVSLKVGAQEPNVRNPGLDTLDKLTEADKNKSKNIVQEHKSNLHNLGYDSERSQADNHKQYKLDKNSNKPEEKKRAAAADKSKLKTLYNLSNHYANSINDLHHDKVKHLITQLAAPKTLYPHTRAWAQTPATGKSGETTHHIENHQEELQHELNSHQHGYTAIPKGQQFHIHANNPDGSPGKRIISISMKGVSGPIKGIAAATKTPFNKKEKPKKQAVNPYNTNESALDEAKGSFRAGYNKAKNRFYKIKQNEEFDLESVLSEFKKGEDIGKPNVGKDTGFKNLEHKLTPKYGKESAKKIAGSVLQKILNK